MKLHSINTEQRLYVMTRGDGFSCYGFDVLDRKVRAVVAWMTQPHHIAEQAARAPTAALGTAEHFEQCSAVMSAGAAYAQRTGLRCNAELVPELIGKEGEHVEMTTPTGERSRFWVGKSSGWLPCHIEKTRRNSIAGASVYVPQGATFQVIGRKIPVE